MNNDFKKMYEEQLRKAMEQAKAKTDNTLDKLSKSVNTGVTPPKPTPELSNYDSENIFQNLGDILAPTPTPSPIETPLPIVTPTPTESVETLMEKIAKAEAELERLKGEIETAIRDISTILQRHNNAPTTPQPPSSNIKVDVRRNIAKSGIEIAFSDKPDTSTILNLKSQGFFFSNRQGIWYAKYNDAKWQFAQGLESQFKTA